MFSFFKEFRVAQQLVQTRYDVIFYAENAYYFQYFHHLLQSIEDKGLKICYLTSDKNDPLLQQEKSFEVVYIRSTLAFVFQRLQASVVEMTMPDLGNFQFRRSRGVGKYVYVFHALVSTHQQYRPRAFDHYDAILCAGPHHETELREAEAIFNLPPRELIAYGYPLLNELEKLPAVSNARKEVLLAPSWYDHGIFQTCLHRILEQMSATDYTLRVRPHSEFIKRNRASFKQLQKTIGRFPHFHMDLEPILWNSLSRADHLITDRSGIAFEFAFMKNSPVLFIDTPLKMQNPGYTQFSNQPVENQFRDALGVCISPKNLEKLPQAMLELHQRKESFRRSIPLVRAKTVFEEAHLENGRKYLLEIINK